MIYSSSSFETQHLEVNNAVHLDTCGMSLILSFKPYDAGMHSLKSHLLASDLST